MKTRMFITEFAGVITSRQETSLPQSNLFGTPWYMHNQIDVPHDAQIIIGDRIVFYEQKTWERKSDTQLIDEGLLPMPAGYIREGDELRPMTAEERIIAGLDEPPRGYKVMDNGIVEMTPTEMIKAGLLTQHDYEQSIAANNKRELEMRLEELQTPKATALAELDKAYAAERHAKMEALLAVEEQPGWPLDVVWPE